MLSNIRGALASGKGSRYFHLLFWTSLTELDALLLAAGSVAAVAASIPFPLLSILFEELVDELYSAIFDTEQEHNKQDLQSSVNRKVLFEVYYGKKSPSLTIFQRARSPLV